MSGLGLYLGLTRNSSLYKYQWTIPTTPGIVQVPTGITFICASTRTAQTSRSTMITGIGANQPVVCYNPILNCYGLQHEPTSTNQQWYSQSYSSWSSQNNFPIDSSNNSDPTGGTAATLIHGNGTSPFIYLSQPLGILTTVNGWNMSQWIAGYNGSPNQADCCFGEASINQILSSEYITPALTWERKTVSTTSNGNITGPTLGYSGTLNTGANGQANKAYYYGLQLEKGRIPTSYIITPSNAAVTRTTTIIKAPIYNYNNFKLRFDTYVWNRTDYDINTYPSTIIFQEDSNTNRILCQITISLGSPVLQLYVNSILVYTGTNVYNFVRGDKWSWRLNFNGTTFNILVYKNDVYQWTETYTGEVPTSMANVVFGSAVDGTYHFSAPCTFIGAT